MRLFIPRFGSGLKSGAGECCRLCCLCSLFASAAFSSWPRLFVRSKKANLVVGYNAGSYYTKAHSLTKTEYKPSPMDAQAKDVLTKKGIDFELVDLSRGLKAGLIAKVRG